MHVARMAVYLSFVGWDVRKRDMRKREQVITSENSGKLFCIL